MTLRILVADDSITIQKIVAMAFENEDVEVEGIGDGQEALDKIPEFKPDIVLADVDMPGLDGFQLSEKIKENPDLANIKVLLLASDFEDFDEGRFNKCQAENHISKPFKSDDIVQMVTQVMEGAQAKAPAEEVLVDEVAPVEEPEADAEPSLEELLESVEKLSTDALDIADEKEPVEEIEDLPTPVEPVEAHEPEEVPEVEEEIIEEPSTVIDDDILSGMIQDVGKEISQDAAAPAVSDEGISGDQVAEVEEEIAPEPAFTGDNDILGEMIHEVETELEEQGSEPEPVLEEQTFSDEVFAEVQPRKMDNLDDLDSAFKEIVAREAKKEPVSQVEAKESEMSALGGIVPEPEDLLERMAPGAFSESERRPHTPEEIDENLNSIIGSASYGATSYQDSRLKEMDFENNDDRFIQVTGEQVKQVLEKSLDSSLQKEMSGLSELIVKTIREVVREITPGIARSVIREEIEKIKKI